MELIVFAKIFPDMTVEQMGEAALDLGVDGLDVAVRPDRYPVTPENISSTLRPAVEKYHGFCNTLKPLANVAGYEPGGAVKVHFWVQMPRSWSKKAWIRM